MKLITIYKNHKYTNLCVSVHETDATGSELADEKHELVDEMSQQFMPAFVVEESELPDLIKQLNNI